YQPGRQRPSAGRWSGATGATTWRNGYRTGPEGKVVAWLMIWIQSNGIKSYHPRCLLSRYEPGLPPGPRTETGAHHHKSHPQQGYQTDPPGHGRERLHRQMWNDAQAGIDGDRQGKAEQKQLEQDETGNETVRGKPGSHIGQAEPGKPEAGHYLDDQGRHTPFFIGTFERQQPLDRSLAQDPGQ